MYQDHFKAGCGSMSCWLPGFLNVVGTRIIFCAARSKNFPIIPELEKDC